MNIGIVTPAHSFNPLELTEFDVVVWTVVASVVVSSPRATNAVDETQQTKLIILRKVDTGKNI